MVVECGGGRSPARSSSPGGGAGDGAGTPTDADARCRQWRGLEVHAAGECVRGVTGKSRSRVRWGVGGAARPPGDGEGRGALQVANERTWRGTSGLTRRFARNGGKTLGGQPPPDDAETAT